MTRKAKPTAARPTAKPTAAKAAVSKPAAGKPVAAKVTTGKRHHRAAQPAATVGRRRTTARERAPVLAAGVGVDAAEPVHPGDVGAWDPPDGPDARTLIDRRQLPRTCYPTHAYLAPADEAGATRLPLIRVRDFNQRALGFRARQDLSALDEAVLRLPAAANRVISVACRVRRSMELGNGWFDGLVEFLHPLPDLAVKDGQLCLIRRRG